MLKRKSREAMDAIKWFLILINFTSIVKGEEASCKYGSPNHQDLFACESIRFESNSSIISDGKVSFGSRSKSRPQTDQTVLCSVSSSRDTYLHVRLNHFYDVCAVTTWTNASNLTATKFKIQYSKISWHYYTEIGQVKYFEAVRNDSGIALHHVQLTTKDIRFRPVNWGKGTCLQFAIHGNIASCKSSQRRMDLWCNKTLSHDHAIASNQGCSGQFRARFDRNIKSPKKQWRCYHESALTSDLRHYDYKSKSTCYFSRHPQLKQVLKSCSHVSRTKKCPSSPQDGNKTSVNPNILAEVLANLSKVNETITEPLSSSVILDMVDVLESLSPEKLLQNTTQYNRDHLAKTFLEVASAVLNETNIPTWISSLSNSTTLSRLLKAVEDFGEVFAKYLECDNKTENGKTFSVLNIKFIAKSCVKRSTFPLKLSSSQGCSLKDGSPNYCNTRTDVMDAAILPQSILDEQQQYQVSFISYKNAHRLFPVEPTKGDTILRSAKVDSRILSLTVKPEGLIFKDNPVAVTLKRFSHNSKNEKDVHCGFWNFSALGTANGAWSTDGCTVLSINTSQVTCQCDHLTNFAILFQVDSNSATQGIHQEVLMWMTYLGCSLSLAAEILCLLGFILLTNMKKTKVKIHFNLIACLAAAHLLFLTGIEKATCCKILCKIVAASLHFLFLASFMWMLVEGIHLLSRIKAFFQPQHEMPIAYGLAYGLTFAIVGATFAVKFDEYGTVQHCWISVASGTQWSFIGPVCGVILVNFVVLGLVLNTLTRTQMFQRRNEWQKIRLAVRASLTILPLLGLTWLFGLLAVNQATVVFQYLFVGFNSLQGVFLFLFHCVVDSEVQTGARSIMRRRRVAQEVMRGASKTQDNTPQDHKQKKVSSNMVCSMPFIVIDEHVEVVQSVRLTRIIKRSQDLRDSNSLNNQDCKPNTNNAWGEQAL